MMAPFATRLIAIVILVSLGICAPVMAAGPTFNTPQDGASVQGRVIVKAEKRHLDRSEAGYVSYDISADKDSGAPAAKTSVAVIHPFELTWDTQETYVNRKNAWDPHNGSRRYPDAKYTITATAFSANGRPVGDPTTITVTVANTVPDVPVDAQGRILLQSGGNFGQQVRYRAEGTLRALLSDEARDALGQQRPAFAEMRMESEWRNVTRKPYGPGHTVDGKRWHGQRDDTARLDPLTQTLRLDWRSVEYGVRDEYPEYGWVEMTGRSLSEMGRLWDERGNLALGGFESDILGAAGGGAAGGAGGGMPGGMPGMGMEAGMGLGMGGPGMAGAGGGMPGMGMEAGMPGGGMGAGIGGAGMGGAATGGRDMANRLAALAPTNLPGLGTKYRSVIDRDSSVNKMQIGDSRWPLAELWSALPTNPVRVGDTWLGGMTVMPFFDQQYHIRVPGGGGGASHGPHHLQPLFHYRLTPELVTPGGANAPAVHVLDGFEYYGGYECARVVSKFRNYIDPETWTPEVMTGWRLMDLNPRLLAGGQSADAMLRVDLTRITYFAYRSGHVVGMEDHYFNRMWVSYNGFENVFASSGRYDPWTNPEDNDRTGSTAVPEPASRGLQRWPGATDDERGFLGAAAPAAGGMGGGQGEMGMGMGPGMGPEMGMGAPGMGMGGPGMAGPPGAMMPGMPGAGPPAGGMAGGMMGPGGAEGGMPGMGAGAATTDMVYVSSLSTLKITEQCGSDALNPRQAIVYAPGSPKPELMAPGPKHFDKSTTQRYIVVEEEGVFYLPTSEKLAGKSGVALQTSAGQLIKLGFKPEPALKF